MENTFEFNELSLQDVNRYKEEALVFNICKDNLHDVHIIENKFTTIDMGGSAECVDIYLDVLESEYDEDIVDLISDIADESMKDFLNPREYNLKNINEYLDPKNFFINVQDADSGTYNLAGMIELLDSKGIEYRGILVVTRVMSNFILDKLQHKSTASYYYFCSKEAYDFLEENPMLGGWLAKHKVILTSNYKEDILELLDICKDDGTLSEYSYDIYKKVFVEGE